MLTITRKKLSIIIAALILGTDIAILYNPNIFLISFFTFLSLITVPGFLFLLILKINKIGFWKYSIFAVGLSIAFLLTTGLSINWTWYALFKIQPLQKDILLYTYNFFILLLTIPAYIRNANLKYSIKIQVPGKLNKALLIFPPTMTAFSIFGAITLNNHGPNTITMSMLAGIALFTLIILFVHKKISWHIYPFAIFFFSLSLLLMLSLRSWYISGWDIQDEYRIFELTRDLGHWSPANIIHDYNSCLSITLLPTMFVKLTGISGEILFKFFYQILFSIVPVSIFFLAKRYTSVILSFLTAMYFISQPFFIQPMTALMRQEIAFLFFALFILALFEKSIGIKTRKLLLLIFGISLIMSHYSTAYITLILLIVTFSIIFIFRLLEKNNFLSKLFSKMQLKKRHVKYHYFIYPEILLLLLGFSLFWFAQVNNSSTHAIEVSESAFNNIKNTFVTDVHNPEVREATALVSKGEVNTLENINIYKQKLINKYQNDKNDRYAVKEIKGVNLLPIFPKKNKPLIQTNYNQQIIFIFNVLKQLTKIFVLVGLGIFLLIKFKSDKHHREFIIFGIIAEGLITLMLINPTLSTNYNLSRLYLQSLIILALPAVIGGLFFFSLLKKFSLYATGISFIIIFLYFSGFTSQILGGEALMQLNNYGNDYDKFYAHATEVASGKWLAEHQNGNVIFADSTANLRLRLTSWINTNPTILPEIIYKYSYVYASFENTVNNKTSAHFEGKELMYTFPHTFLEENKNVVYNNGETKIYK